MSVLRSPSGHVRERDHRAACLPAGARGRPRITRARKPTRTLSSRSMAMCGLRYSFPASMARLTMRLSKVNSRLISPTDRGRRSSGNSCQVSFRRFTLRAGRASHVSAIRFANVRTGLTRSRGCAPATTGLRAAPSHREIRARSRLRVVSRSGRSSTRCTTVAGPPTLCPLLERRWWITVGPPAVGRTSNNGPTSFADPVRPAHHCID